MRLERLTPAEEDEWRAAFGRENWIFGSLTLNITLPEFANGRPKLETMHFGYYLQSLHLSVHDREELPRKLLYALATRRPKIDFLELVGPGIRIPHAFPPGFSIDRVLRLAYEELTKIPLEG